MKLNVCSLQGDPVEGFAKPGAAFNVVTSELTAALAWAGVEIHMLTRKHHPALPPTRAISKNCVLHYVDDGDHHQYSRKVFSENMQKIRDAVAKCLEQTGIQNNTMYSQYWLSGATVRPLVDSQKHFHSFHSLASESMDASRLASEKRWKEEKALVQSAHIITHTAIEMETLRQFYDQPRRYSTIPLGYDSNIFRPLDKKSCRKELKLPLDTFIALYAGRFSEEKGVLELLHTYAEGRQSNHLPSSALIFMGCRPAADEQLMLSKMRQILEHCDCADEILLLPVQERELVVRYMNAADVCVFPSFREHFGTAAVEAMACGVPVITSDVGGYKSTVPHGKAGFRVPVGNRETLQETLVAIAKDADLRRDLGNHAAIHAVEHFTWERIAQQLKEILLAESR